MAYTKVELPNCQDHYYVVTMLTKESSCQRCIVSSNTGTTNSCSTLNQEILDEDLVDIRGVASKINQEYGINITEEKWKGILSSHGLQSGAKLVGSLVSPIQIDHYPEDNDVAECLLLLDENSTLISGITDAVAADTIYIKTQVFRLLRYYSPAPRNIARSDWVTQNITHNITSSIIQPYGLHSL